MTAIAHYATGGEIDSFYNAEANAVEMADHSIAADYLAFLGGLGAQPVESTTLMLRSKLSAEDDTAVADRVLESSADRILVTAYSYYYRLGELLARRAVLTEAQPDQRIVLAGSSTPIKCNEASASGFDLGAATAALQSHRTDLPKVMTSTSGRVSNTRGNFQDTDILSFDEFLVVPAGGSIDFVPNGRDGVEPASESVIPWYLNRVVRTQKDFRTAPAIMKDSRSLTVEDQDTIIDTIKESTIGHVLITVGLIRAQEVGERIDAALGHNDRERTIVLAGSNYLLRMAGFTDAPYALGYAYGQLGLLDPGVHRTQLDRTASFRQPMA